MEQASARLISVETVRCLGCGKVYAKPTGRSTLSTNPGCPDCGYLGWLPGAEWVNPTWPRVRSAADPPLLRRQRSG